MASKQLKEKKHGGKLEEKKWRKSGEKALEKKGRKKSNREEFVE